MAGLRPVVEEREVRAVLPDPSLLEGETSLEHAEAQPRRARGETNRFNGESSQRTSDSFLRLANVPCASLNYQKIGASSKHFATTFV